MLKHKDIVKEPLKVNKKNIFEVIENCRAVLDEQNVPSEGRKLAIWNEELQDVEFFDIPEEQKATDNG